MTSCPACGQPLARKQSEFGVFWGCEGCGAWLIGLPILRRTLDPGFYARLWQSVLNIQAGTEKLCPGCSKPMNQVSVGTPEAPIDPYVCKSCNLAFLSAEERAHLPVRFAPEPAKPEPEKPKDVLPPEAAQLLAIHQAEVMAENARRENQFDASHLPLWQKFVAAFGFPVEDSWEVAHAFPWVTFLVVLATSATSLYFFTDFKASVEAYGFVPTEYDRSGYLTFLTCFLVHGNALHLIGNMYFLFTFGRGVEDRIGALGFLALLVLATLGGSLFTLCFSPDSDIPNIGASGGIAGVLIFYGFAFPKRRLVVKMSVPMFTTGQLIRLPAWVVLGIWVGLQVLGIFNQRGSGISYSGHLGGLLAGLVFWSAWKWKNKEVPRTVQA
ncbi:MAG TPA: rhomboid family intramembrane serine protease [bacterium]|nr:rhomboid family intramembrane serine protease [bacterium]